MKIVVSLISLALLVAVTSANAIPDSLAIESSPYAAYLMMQKPRAYKFGWIVKDDGSHNNYAHRQVMKDDTEVTGTYRVLLPDGRTQIVSYEAGDDGYVADVQYEEHNYDEVPVAQGKFWQVNEEESKQELSDLEVDNDDDEDEDEDDGDDDATEDEDEDNDLDQRLREIDYEMDSPIDGLFHDELAFFRPEPFFYSKVVDDGDSDANNRRTGEGEDAASSAQTLPRTGSFTLLRSRSESSPTIPFSLALTYMMTE